jgi:hypothetical protein
MNNNWWDDFLIIETYDKEQGEVVAPVVDKYAGFEDLDTYFNLPKIEEEFDFEMTERELFSRMDDFHFQDIMRLFAIGMFYDIVHQIHECRTDLFQVTLRLEAFNNDVEEADAKLLASLKRRQTQLERELDWLLEEKEEVEFICEDLNYFD